MVRIEFNGKPFDPATFKDTFTAAALEAIAEQVREQIARIRDPDTGEFPTVVIRATSLNDIKLVIEGSDALIARVQAALNGSNEPPAKDVEHAESMTEESIPKVFLSYATEDKNLAEEIARGLMQNGIDTWWAEWEIRAGDSLRQKIDAGLGNCTHFLVLLTPVSIGKPWVNQEMDAGFVRMLSGRIEFLPVRVGLEIGALPPLLSGIHSPEIKDKTTDLKQLIHDIHRITRKPPLGPPPPAAKRDPNSRYSPAATALARVFVERSETATALDPQLTESELIELTGLSRDDLNDAIYELQGLVDVHEYTDGGFVSAEPRLYAEFDARWKPWDPAKDALRIATDVHSDADFPDYPGDIAERYGWSPRRMNPALAYLMERDLIEKWDLDEATYLTGRVSATDATRRFLKSRRNQ